MGSTKIVAAGMIGGAMVLPVMFAFGTIIFRDSEFAPFLPCLVKLCLFSGLIHQLLFSTFSSIPYAVGQVQDAGLIFLSAICTSIADASSSSHEMLSTSLFTTAACTSLLGLGLVLVGKLQLASFVQFLPMPVIGGYLAFIGFFCAESGTALMSGKELAGISDWAVLLNFKSMALCIPGVLLGGGLFYVCGRFKGDLVMPICMVSSILLFYVVLFLTGSTIEEAKEYGWIMQTQPVVPFYDTWQYFDISQINLKIALSPTIVVQWLAMFLVVAFSSSLDVVAIETEAGVPLDYNAELQTVGWSNLGSGLCGGFTGSYIFSQTLFNARQGVKSRACGYIICAIEMLVFVAPIDIMGYIPKMFFGMLLWYFGFALMLDWLVSARSKVSKLEYVVICFTFGGIIFSSIEIGMVLGIIGQMVVFVCNYARLPSVFVPEHKTSGVIRTYEEQRILLANQQKVLVLTLRGHVFFGSAVQLLEDIKKHLIVAKRSGALIKGKEENQQNNLQVMERGPKVNILFSKKQRSDSVPSVYSPLISTRSSRISPEMNTSSFQRTSATKESATVPIPEDHPPSLNNGTHRALSLKWPTPTRHGSSAEGAAAAAAAPGGGGGGGAEKSQMTLFDLQRDRAFSVEDRARLITSTSDDMKGVTSDGAGCDGFMDTSIEAGVQDYAPPGGLALSRGTSVQVVNSYMDQWASRPSRAELTTGDDHGTVLDDDVEWVVLDFEQVTGIDATSAQNCFRTAKHLFSNAGVKVVYAGLKPSLKKMLTVNGVLGETDLTFPRLVDGLEWCEEDLLASAQFQGGRSLYVTNAAKDRFLHLNTLLNGKHQRFTETPVTKLPNAQVLQDILRDYLELDHLKADEKLEALLHPQKLSQFFSFETHGTDHVFFEEGSIPEKIFFVQEGAVELQMSTNSCEESASVPHRFYKVSAGGIFGEAGFFLRAPQECRAVAARPTAAWSLDRRGMARLQLHSPSLCVLVQQACVKTLALSYKNQLRMTKCQVQITKMLADTTTEL